MRKPRIPMFPDQLPQQRLFEVVGLPERPEPFDFVASYTLPEDTVARGDPGEPYFLCHVEWAWSPMHERISTYDLNRGGIHWSLWDCNPDPPEVWGQPRWAAVACVPRGQASERQAAVYLLLEAWAMEKAVMDLESSTGSTRRACSAPSRSAPSGSGYGTPEGEA